MEKPRKKHPYLELGAKNRREWPDPGAVCSEQRARATMLLDALATAFWPPEQQQPGNTAETMRSSLETQLLVFSFSVWNYSYINLYYDDDTYLLNISLMRIFISSHPARLLHEHLFQNISYLYLFVSVSRVSLVVLCSFRFQVSLVDQFKTCRVAQALLHCRPSRHPVGPCCNWSAANPKTARAGTVAHTPGSP